MSVTGYFVGNALLAQTNYSAIWERTLEKKDSRAPRAIRDSCAVIISASTWKHIIMTTKSLPVGVTPKIVKIQMQILQLKVADNKILLWKIRVNYRNYFLYLFYILNYMYSNHKVPKNQVLLVITIL